MSTVGTQAPLASGQARTRHMVRPNPAIAAPDVRNAFDPRFPFSVRAGKEACVLEPLAHLSGGRNGCITWFAGCELSTV
jgi:hypothetical protein